MSEYLFIIILIAIIVLVLTYLKFSTILKPNILFTLLWLVGSLLINFKYAGILNINERTNFHIIIALVGFNVSTLFFCKRDTYKLSRAEILRILDIKSSWKTILYTNITLVVICVPYFFKMIKIMLVDSFYQVRVHAFSYDNLYELICSKIINLPMFAFFNILLIITVLKIVLGEKGNVKLYLLMIFDTIFFSLITGSRNYFAKPFIYFIIAYALMHVVSKKKIKINVKTILIGVIIFFILDFAIKARSLRGLSPLENILIYLFGGIAYYDKIVFSNRFLLENSVMLYGQGVFGWIISPFVYLLSLMGIIGDYVAESIIGRVSGQGIYISNYYNFNALTTAMYPMWRDFGEVGIFVGMIVFAFFVSHYRNKLFRYFNQKNLLIYMTFLCAVSECTQYYEPLFIRFSVQIIIIHIIWRINKSKMNK